MEHYMKPLDKKEVDKLIRLVNRVSPDLDGLEKIDMASLSHIGHLYLLDNVTLKELSEFWGISRNGVRKRLKEKVKSKAWSYKLLEKRENATIRLCPNEVFMDIGEYINFLKWRSVGRRANSIPVSEVAAILGIAKRSVYRYIRNGELHTYGADESMVMRISFTTFVQKIIFETEMKLHFLNDYMRRTYPDGNVQKKNSGSSFCDSV